MKRHIRIHKMKSDDRVSRELFSNRERESPGCKFPLVQTGIEFPARAAYLKPYYGSRRCRLMHVTHV